MTYAWLWTLLAFILTWMVFHLIKIKKVATEDVEAEAEERRDGATDVIIVGSGVASASLAYALAKVYIRTCDGLLHAKQLLVGEKLRSAMLINCSDQQR